MDRLGLPKVRVSRRTDPKPEGIVNGGVSVRFAVVGLVIQWRCRGRR
jgi:hypothetical protein